MELNITEKEYYNALSISSDSDFQIHIKHEPNDCFISFFIEGLQAWKVNIDTQPESSILQACVFLKIRRRDI